MPFAYYDRLSAAQKKIYRKSDEINALEFADLERVKQHALLIEAALATGKGREVSKAVTAFSTVLLADLSLPPIPVHVRATRPSMTTHELHGLYTYADGDEPPKIEVWMKTAANGQVVKFRTFLRTLVHELLHHIDVARFGFEESFHTHGFYRRESNVMKQLVPSLQKREPKAPKEPKEPKAKVPKPAATKPERPKKPVQLKLF